MTKSYSISAACHYICSYIRSHFCKRRNKIYKFITIKRSNAALANHCHANFDSRTGEPVLWAGGTRGILKQTVNTSDGTSLTTVLRTIYNNGHMIGIFAFVFLIYFFEIHPVSTS